MGNKLQRAILHTTGKYSEEDLKEYTPEQKYASYQYPSVYRATKKRHGCTGSVSTN